MNKLWVRLSIAFSSVIIVAILLMVITGWIFNPDRRSDIGRPQSLRGSNCRSGCRAWFWAWPPSLAWWALAQASGSAAA